MKEQSPKEERFLAIDNYSEQNNNHSATDRRAMECPDIR